MQTNYRLNLLTFIVINFLGLYLGALFTEPGVNSNWYITANKASWTPPGWMFGVVWFLIMILYGIYMARVWGVVDQKKNLCIIYLVQWVLNVSWNLFFFYLHFIWVAEIILILLTALLISQFIIYKKASGNFSILLFPYIIWLILANTLNIYFVLNN